MLKSKRDLSPQPPSKVVNFNCPRCKEDAKKKHVWISLRLLMSQQLLLAVYHVVLYEGIPLYLAQARHPNFSGLQHYIFSYF